MSGIEIDVNLRADAAKRDLQDINKGLKNLADSSKKTGQSFSQLSPKNMQNIARDTQRATISAKSFTSSATRGMKNTASAANNTASAIDQVKSAVVAMTAAFAAFTAVNSFHKASDNLTNMQNKLKLVTDSTAELIERQNQLALIARNTRTDLAGTISVFSSFSKAMDSMGYSSERVLRVTETMQKGIALSGASAEGAKAALLQFSQGLSSGALRGEELNSVMEQLPYIANGLARALGKTTGQLREIASTGALAPEVLVKALETMSAKADADFGKTAFTVEASMSQMGQSISRFTGELSKYTGASERFGKRVLKIADYFGEASQLIGGQIYTVKQNIKNYIDSLTIFDAFELTLKAALKFDISPLDVYDKYKFYSKAKSAINSIQDFFGMRPKMEVDAGGIEVTGLDVNIEQQDKQQSGLQRLLTNSKRLGFAIGDAFKVTGEQFARILPVLQKPLIEADTMIWQFYRNTKASLNAWVYDALQPTRRAMEEFTQGMTLWATGDNKLERAWVRLFKSSTFKETIDNLEDLNQVRRQIRFDDKSFVGRELIRNFRNASYSVQDLLIQVGLLDNKLIRVRDSRLDRLTKYVADFGRVTKRVYQDVFATTLEPLFVRFTSFLGGAAYAVLDTISDLLNSSTGSALAMAFGDSIINGLQGVFDRWETAEEGDSFMSRMFSFNFGSRILRALRATLIDIGEFIIAFFSTLGTRIAEAFADGTFSRMFEQLRSGLSGALDGVLATFMAVKNGITERLGSLDLTSRIGFDITNLSEAGDYIIAMFQRVLQKTADLSKVVATEVRRFGEVIKDIFFRVYDAVVGHSYWPDLIDGVIAHTYRLFEAESVIIRFAQRVGELFRGLFASLKEYGLSAGGVISDFTVRITSVDIGDMLTSLRKNLEAMVVSALMFAFGGARAKIAALSFFASTLNGALNFAFDAFAPTIAKGLGEALREIGETIPGMILDSFNSLISAAPKLLDGILGGFSPLSNFMSEWMGWLPLVNNELLHTAVTIAGIMALISSGTRSTIQNLVFGVDEQRDASGKVTKARKDGVLDYVAAMRGQTRKAGENWFGDFFSSPKLAGLGALALGSALTESVSLLSALEIGLPLLAFGLFGKDGGGALARQGLLVGGSVVRAAYEGAVNTLAKVAGQDSILTKLFSAPLSWGKGGDANAAPQQISRLRQTANDVVDAVKQTFLNAKANAVHYNKGDMSFVDMLLIKETTFGTGANMMVKKERLAFGRIVSDFIDALVSHPYVAKTSGFVTHWFDVGTKGLNKAIGRTQEQLAAFKSATARIFSNGWDFILDQLGNMARGFMALARVVGGMKTVLAVVFLGLSGTAFAASDASTAIGGLVTDFGTLIKMGATFGAILLSVNAVLKAISAFKGAKSTYSAMKDGSFVDESFDEGLDKFRAKKKLDRERALADNIAALRTRLDRKAKGVMKDSIFETEKERFDTMMALRRRNEEVVDRYRKSRSRLSQAAEIAELAQFQAEYDRRQAQLGKVGSSKNSFMAGLTGVSIQVSEGFRKARTSVASYFDAVKSRLSGAEGQSRSFSNRVRGLLENTFKVDPAVVSVAVDGVRGLAEGFRLLAKAKIADGLATGFEGLMQVLAGARGIAKGTGKNIGGGILDALSSVFSMAGLKKVGGKLFGGLKKLGSSGLIKGMLKAGGLAALAGVAVGGLGALGTALFGKGDSFFDKLGWVYDKLRAIVGLSATTGSGRKSSIQDLIGGGNIVGDQSVSFRNELAGVDFDKLSDAQYKVVLDSATATNEAFDNLNASYIRHGRLTAAQLEEINNITKEQADVLQRLPQKSGSSLQEMVSSFSKSVDDVNDDFFTMAENLFGIDTVLGETVNAISNARVNFPTLTRLFDNMTSWPAIILGTIGTFIGGPVGFAIGTAIGGVLSFIGEVVYDAFAGLGSWIGEQITSGIEWAKKQIDDSETIQTMGRGWDHFTSNVVRGWNRALKMMASEPTQLQLQIKAEVEEIMKGSGLDVMSTSLTASDQKALKAKYKAYQAAAEDYMKLDMEGWNGKNADSQEEFNVKLGEAMLAYIDARIELSAFAKQMTPTAAAMYKLTQLTRRQQAAFEGLAESGIDFGKEYKLFTGNEEDLARFKEFSAKIAALREKLKTEGDTDARRGLKLEITDLENQAKALEKYIKDNTTLQTDIPMKVNLVGNGATAEDLQRLFYVDPAAYRRLDELSKSYNQFSAELNNPTLTTTPARIKFLQDSLAQFRQEAQGLVQVIPTIEKLNTALNELAGVSLNAEMLGSIGQTGFDNLNKKVGDVAKLKQEYADLEKSGASIEVLTAKLKQLEGAQRAVTSGGQAAVIEFAKGINADKSINTMARAQRIASALKVEIPESLMGNTAALAAWADLQIKITESSQLLNSEVAKGAEGNQALIAKLAASFASATKEMGYLTDVSVFTVDSLLGQLGEAGIQLNNFSFSRLASGAQSALAGIGKQMEDITTQLSRASADGIVGEGLTRLMDKRQALLKQARELLADVMHATGAGINEGLSRIGISEFKAIAKLSKDRLSALLEMDKQLELAKLDLADTTDLDAYVSSVRKAADLERQAARMVADASRNFTTDVDTFNSVFNSGLDAGALSRMNAGVFGEMASYAYELQRALEDAIEYGTSAAGETVGQLYEKMRQASKSGAYVALFATMREDVANAFTDGAKTAFENLSNVLGELSIDFDAFMMIPDAVRDAYSAQGAALASYEKALNLPNLSDKLVSILGQAGKPIEDILTEFEQQFYAETGSSFAAAMQTPTDRLITSQDSLRTEVQRLADTMAGKPGTTASTGGQNAQGERPGGTLSASRADFDRLALERMLLAEKSRAAAVASSNTGLDKARAALSNKGLIDIQAMRLATEKQLKVMTDTGNLLAKKTIELQVAMNSGMPTAQLQKDVLVLEESLRDLGQNIQDAAMKATEAGKSFASEISSSLTTGVADMLKGKADEGKSVTETFIDNFLDTFTNSVIDAFVAGLMEPLTGDNGVITVAMEGLGSALFSSGKAGTGAVLGAMGSDEAAGATDAVVEAVAEGTEVQGGFFSNLGGILDDGFKSVTEGVSGLGGMFMNGLSGLGSLFGLGGGGGPNFFSLITSGISAWFGGGGGGGGGSATYTGAHGFAAGGQVTGPGTGTSDSINAWLSNGEFVVNSAATRKHLSLLRHINSGKAIGAFALGGLVGTPEFKTTPNLGGSATVTPVGDRGPRSEQVFNIQVTGDISKMTRKEIQMMIPQIAAGVSKHNYERRGR